MKGLIEIEFKKEFVDHFTGDHTGNLKPRQTPGMFYSKALPTPVQNPQLLAWSEDLAKEMGIMKPASQQEVDLLAGNFISPSMYPYAACYGGHQFGQWAGQLGDGRAITLGEHQYEGKSWELQLKGAGPTAYSRRADGRAVLRSSLREYLMSEAMYYLGVPTTRALSLVTTGEQVMRDMFYDGHPELEPGAVVMRVAPSFLRFGNFEILTARGELENLKKLINWTIDRYYPHIKGEDRILLWYREIAERTALLMVEWLRVGFVHGVMNTDNMSILGLTIDYGPYSMVDDYDPYFTPNTTDLPGRRYAFGRQASVAQWNLGCLAGALAPLFETEDDLVKELHNYAEVFQKGYQSMMANKLGLDEVRPEDTELISRFEKILVQIRPDMTMFFQYLITLPAGINEQDVVGYFSGCFYREPDRQAAESLSELIRSYNVRILSNKCSREDSVSKMKKASPRFILRNYLLAQAIDDLGNGDHQLFEKLQQAIKEPYSDKHDEFFVKRPDWATQKAGCSMLSCSS